MRQLLCMTLLICLMPTTVGSAVAAEEQNSETIADVRCAAVGLRILQLPEASQKSAGMLVAIYYIGRLDGRTPKLDLEDLIGQEIGKMDDAAFRAEAVRCGNGLTVRGQQLTEIGEHLVKRGQAMQQQSTPSKYVLETSPASGAFLAPWTASGHNLITAANMSWSGRTVTKVPVVMSRRAAQLGR